MSVKRLKENNGEGGGGVESQRLAITSEHFFLLLNIPGSDLKNISMPSKKTKELRVVT